METVTTQGGNADNGKVQRAGFEALAERGLTVISTDEQPTKRTEAQPVLRVVRGGRS